MVTDPIISFHFSSPSVFGHKPYHKFTFFPSLFHGAGPMWPCPKWQHLPSTQCGLPCRCALLALVPLTFGSRPARMVPPTCSWGMLPPCTSHCRLSADGLLASSSFFPNKYQPFFHKNPVVSLGILSSSLLGSLLLILLFGSPSPHLLVPLPAHIQAAQGLPQLLSHSFLPPLLLLVCFLTPS